jgi:hypothetical protein
MTVCQDQHKNAVLSFTVHMSLYGEYFIVHTQPFPSFVTSTLIQLSEKTGSKKQGLQLTSEAAWSSDVLTLGFRS